MLKGFVMREIWLRKNASKRLVIFFSGFASDEKLLQGFKDFGESDFLMLCDYKNLDFPTLPKYESIAVIAWSFGAWVANYFRDKIKNTSSYTCINASPFAVDDEYGIQKAIFEATTANFSEENKEKFFLRICKDRKYYQEHRKFLCDRSASDLKAELEFLGKAFKENKYYKGEWDKVIISKKDRIFPKENLFKLFPNADLHDFAHFDLELIKSTIKSVSNRDLYIKQSFEKHLNSYEKEAKAQKSIAENLAKMCFDFKASKILELGAGTGFLTKQLAQNFSDSKFYINDLSEKSCQKALSNSKLDAKVYVGDLILIDFQESYDAIFSASCFQWVENQLSLYKKLHYLLKAKGMLCFSTFSKNNFKEVTKLTGKSLNYLDESEIVVMLQALGFEVLESKTDCIVETFDSPLEVLKHIKSTGVNGTFKAKWTKKSLQDFCSNYESLNGKFPITYEAIYIKARKI